MDADFSAINESQWILCLLQITGLMLIGWIAGRIALHRFPDISASVGVVALTASAGLIVLTWAGVPRPFALIATANDQASNSATLEFSHPAAEISDSTDESAQSVPSLLSSLAAQFNWTFTPSHNSAAQGTWQAVNSVRILSLLLLLTLLGGLVGVFRITLSSKTIYALAKSSWPIEDAKIRVELDRILSLLPNARPNTRPNTREHEPNSVRQFNGPGSPFVSWLTGDTIFVPESFLNWSDSEQSVSLAHEIGHLQRRDHYCRLITQFTFCLTWAPSVGLASSSSNFIGPRIGRRSSGCPSNRKSIRLLSRPFSTGASF